MKGRNIITLCQAEMIEAVQFYFNNKLFMQGQCPTIKRIDWKQLPDGNTEVYDIIVEENPELTKDTGDE